jgi:HSP20 family protein
MSTMLMRFDPFRELDRLLSPQDGGTRSMTIPMDAYREGDAFIVQFDVPGVDPSSIDLTVEKNVLTIRAERPFEQPDDKDVLVSERPHGTFTRQLFLGDALDAEHIEATYDKGVLTLRVPVAEQAKPRKVEVAAAESSGSQPTIEAQSTAA